HLLDAVLVEPRPNLGAELVVGDGGCHWSSPRRRSGSEGPFLARVPPRFRADARSPVPAVWIPPEKSERAPLLESWGPHRCQVQLVCPGGSVDITIRSPRPVSANNLLGSNFRVNKDRAKLLRGNGPNGLLGVSTERH